MKLRTLLDTILIDQKITINILNLNRCTDRIIVRESTQEEIPYSTLAEFLDCAVITTQAEGVGVDNEPVLYIEVDADCVIE